jgi:HK97 family phage prohead protease
MEASVPVPGREPKRAVKPLMQVKVSRSDDTAAPASLTYARTFALDSIEISRSHSDGRTVEAYAAVFNSPAEVRDGHGHYTEVISPSAFAKTLVERAHKVGVFYNHGYNLAGQPDMLGSVPIGTPVEIKADTRGLFTVTRYNRSALAESVLEAIRNGDIRGQSFRGRIYQSTPLRVPRSRAGDPLPVVTRTELGLTEYGPTPSPVYESAAITAVRAEQIVASIAGLSDEERHELLRMLTSTTPPGPETSTATPDSGAGSEEPRVAHSGRLAIRRALLRAEMTRKGVRRG